jgi:hypothetical protein
LSKIGEPFPPAEIVNRGYRRYLKSERGAFTVAYDKVKKELYRHIEAAGHGFEWSDIKQDLKSLREITLEENDKRPAIRTQCQGTCGKVFQAVGVAFPPTIHHPAGQRRPHRELHFGSAKDDMCTRIPLTALHIF